MDEYLKKQYMSRDHNVGQALENHEKRQVLFGLHVLIHLLAKHAGDSALFLAWTLYLLNQCEEKCCGDRHVDVGSKSHSMHQHDRIFADIPRPTIHRKGPEYLLRQGVRVFLHARRQDKARAPLV